MQSINEEYEAFVQKQYAGKTLEERQEPGQFFTPPELTVKLLEKLDIKEDETLLDPCLGAGGLIAAAIVSGKVKPENCYGIELDQKILDIAKERLGRLGVPEKNLRWGNALNPDCYENWDKDGYTFDPNTNSVTYPNSFRFGRRICFLQSNKS
jgi:type I restriction-modification system DNA methylase subunit